MTWILATRGKQTESALAFRCSLLLLLASLFVFSARAQRGHATHHRHKQSGDLHGGQQPIAGSKVYLFAISNQGYGTAPISLLDTTKPSVLTDSSGNGYILTGADGSLDISGLYANHCHSYPNATSTVYLQALGGDSGYGGNNSAIDLISILPSPCDQMPYAPSVNISELTTVAAAWALVRFASVSTASFASSTGNQQALLNAVTYANNLVSGETGAVGSSVYNGTVVIPQLTIPLSTINTIGNLLAACVNTASASSGACSALFNDAANPGAPAPPVDVLQAALDIALHPENNVAALFADGVSPLPAFEPALSVAPSKSWSITYGIATNTIAHSNTITIDHTKVANTDQSNFPVAIAIPANPSLTSSSNGGFLQSPLGYDILFSSDSAGQNLMDWEIDNYSPTTGAATFWVRIPSLSASTDTVLYMWYGIPSVANSLGNALGVWSNKYLSVYHFGTTTNLGTLDSGIAGYNLSGIASPGSGIGGGGAASFNGDSSQFLYSDGLLPALNGVTAYPSGNSPVTLEVWEKHSSASTPLVGPSGSELIGYGSLASNGAVAILDYLNDTGFGLNFEGASTAYYLGNPVDTKWHQMVGVFGGGAIQAPSSNPNAPITQTFLDGQPATQGYTNGTPSITTNELTIGQYPGVRGCCTVNGLLDEVRISSGVRLADWIATEFNNLSAPNSFRQLFQLCL